jgi:hypothetical protein
MNWNSGQSRSRGPPSPPGCRGDTRSLTGLAASRGRGFQLQLGCGRRRPKTVEAMPFRNYAVNPGDIEAMCTTLHMVCQALDLDCDEFNPMTNLIVDRIVELARSGDINPLHLSDQVLLSLSASERPSLG